MNTQAPLDFLSPEQQEKLRRQLSPELQERVKQLKQNRPQQKSK